MDLSPQQARRFFLSGTVAFPTPFLSSGIISFETNNWTLGVGQPALATNFVVVQEHAAGDRTIVRVIKQEDVAALFVPGEMIGSQFEVSNSPTIDNLEQGLWFYNTKVDVEAIQQVIQPKPDTSFHNRTSSLRGIAYALASAQIWNIAEIPSTAAESCDIDWPDPHVGRISCVCRWPCR